MRPAPRPARPSIGQCSPAGQAVRARLMASMWQVLVPQQPPSTASCGCVRRRLDVLPGQLGRVAGVELGGLVELGVAHRGGVGPDAPDPLRPGLRRVEHGGEVGRVGAVDHVVGGEAAGGGVDGGDGLAQRLAGGQAPVGLHRERDDHRHGGVPGGRGDADRLLDVGHRDRRDQIGLGGGERAHLGGVVVAGLLGAHPLAGLVAVAPGPDAAADHDRGRRRLVAAPDLAEQRHGRPVDIGQALDRVALAGAPVGVGPPRRRLQHDAQAVPGGDGHVGLEVADQAPGGPRGGRAGRRRRSRAGRARRRRSGWSRCRRRPGRRRRPAGAGDCGRWIWCAPWWSCPLGVSVRLTL